MYALGLGDRLVGVSHECDFPPAARKLPAVTKSLIPGAASSGEIDRLVRAHAEARRPLYALDAAALEALRPDLVITQSLCNVCAVSEDDVRDAACSLPTDARVVNLEARSFGDVLAGIGMLASHAGVEDAGRDLVDGLRLRAEQVVARSARMSRTPRFVFLEWLDPPFGCGHWNPELIRMAGCTDPFGQEAAAARTITWSAVEAFRPELIFVACCGFDVERTCVDLPALAAMENWRDLPAVRSNQVWVTDGAQYFSRPGPRLVDSLEILAHAVAPEVHPPPANAPAAVRVDVVALIETSRAAAITLG